MPGVPKAARVTVEDESVEDRSALCLRLGPSLRAPRLQKLVFTREEAVHGRVVIHALDPILGDDQLVSGAVRTETRFARHAPRASNENVQHRSHIVGHSRGLGEVGCGPGQRRLRGLDLGALFGV
jgi:hypothetical protein